MYPILSPPLFLHLFQKHVMITGERETGPIACESKENCGLQLCMWVYTSETCPCASTNTPACECKLQQSVSNLPRATCWLGDTTLRGREIVTGMRVFSVNKNKGRQADYYAGMHPARIPFSASLGKVWHPPETPKHDSICLNHLPDVCAWQCRPQHPVNLHVKPTDYVELAEHNWVSEVRPLS